MFKQYYLILNNTIRILRLIFRKYFQNITWY